MQVDIIDSNHNTTIVTSASYSYQHELKVNVHNKYKITYIISTRQTNYIDRSVLLKLATYYSHIFTNVNPSEMPQSNKNFYCDTNDAKNTDEFFYLLFYKKQYKYSKFKYLKEAPELFEEYFNKDIRSIGEVIAAISGQFMVLDYTNILFLNSIYERLYYNNLRIIKPSNIDFIRKLVDIIDHKNELDNVQLSQSIKDYQVITSDYTCKNYPTPFNHVFDLPVSINKFINYLQDISVGDYLKLYKAKVSGTSAYRVIEECHKVLNKDENKTSTYLNNALNTYQLICDKFNSPENVQELVFFHYYLINNYQENNTIDLINDGVRNNNYSKDELVQLFNLIINEKSSVNGAWINDFSYINTLIGEMQKAGLTTKEIISTFDQVRESSGRLTVRQWKKYLNEIDFCRDYHYNWWRDIVL